LCLRRRGQSCPGGVGLRFASQRTYRLLAVVVMMGVAVLFSTRVYMVSLLRARIQRVAMADLVGALTDAWPDLVLQFRLQ
jgi:hypothetical protein